MVEFKRVRMLVEVVLMAYGCEFNLNMDGNGDAEQNKAKQKAQAYPVPGTQTHYLTHSSSHPLAIPPLAPAAIPPPQLQPAVEARYQIPTARLHPVGV